MNWLWVHTDATVVISLITTVDGGELPKTNNIAIAGLSPLPLLTKASPPLARTYRITSAPTVSSLLSVNCPLLLVLVRPSRRGSPVLAAQSVTVEFATGPPPAWTCPSKRTAASLGAHAQASTVAVRPIVRKCAVSILSIFVRLHVARTDRPELRWKM